MSDPTFGQPRRGARFLDYVIYLLGVVGLTWALASVWLGMRAVMDLGGYCASGGPYEIAVQCPDGVSLIMILAFPIGFLGAGLMAWKGDTIGKGYAALVGLAWPALFLSLGFNFLQYGFAPPDGEGLVWGWLIPGVIFILMGGFPLIALLGKRDHTTILPGMPPRPTPRNYAELGRALRESALARESAARTTPAGVTVGRVETAGADGPLHLVDGLERLATLHRDGSLGDADYEAATRALIDSAARGGSAPA